MCLLAFNCMEYTQLWCIVSSSISMNSCVLSFQNEVGSEMILSNAESYGQYFVQALMNENVTKSNDIAATMAITGDNIGICVHVRDIRIMDMRETSFFSRVGRLSSLWRLFCSVPSLSFVVFFQCPLSEVTLYF